jgi:hypothetical protein
MIVWRCRLGNPTGTFLIQGRLSVYKEEFMGLPVRVVSCSNVDNSSRLHDHLWVLVGGGEYFNRATAFYMGPDYDIEGDDLSSRNIDELIVQAKQVGLVVDRDDVETALSDYRRARKC